MSIVVLGRVVFQVFGGLQVANVFGRLVVNISNTIKGIEAEIHLWYIFITFNKYINTAYRFNAEHQQSTCKDRESPIDPKIARRARQCLAIHIDRRLARTTRETTAERVYTKSKC